MIEAFAPRPWFGAAFRHIPAGSPTGVLDFRFAGRSPSNRWNRRGDPTLYLASDQAVALAGFARHLQQDGPSTGQSVERALFRIQVSVDALLDLADSSVREVLRLENAPHCFLDQDVARSTAEFLRHATTAQALLVPSMAFLDAPDRWVLVLFLDKFPADHQQFITAVESAGTFRVDG